MPHDDSIWTRQGSWLRRPELQARKYHLLARSEVLTYSLQNMFPRHVGFPDRISSNVLKERLLTHFVFVFVSSRKGDRQGNAVPILKPGEKRNP